MEVTIFFEHNLIYRWALLIADRQGSHNANIISLQGITFGRNFGSLYDGVCAECGEYLNGGIITEDC